MVQHYFLAVLVLHRKLKLFGFFNRQTPPYQVLHIYLRTENADAIQKMFSVSNCTDHFIVARFGKKLCVAVTIQSLPIDWNKPIVISPGKSVTYKGANRLDLHSASNALARSRFLASFPRL